MAERDNIPKHWQIKKLGEVCHIIMGQSPPSTSYNTNGIGLPFFQGKAEFTELYPVVEKWCNSPNKIAEPNDILLSVRAPVGTTNIANIKCCIGRGLAAIRYDNYKYVFYFLKSIEQELDSKGTGTTFRAISGETIRMTEIPVPPPAEQKAIVTKIEELLSELENGKQQLQTAQQQLKVYRQSLLKWAFEGKLTNKNVKEGELPKGWKFEELKNVCVIKRGKSKHRPRNEPALFGGKYPFIQTGDIREVNGGYIKKYSQTYSELGLQQSKLWPKGTLCITIAANIGETAILDFDACFPDSVVGLLSDEKLLLNKYTNYFFISHKSKLEKLAPATAQKNINVDILEKVKIPLPSIDEQQFIVSELESKLTVCDKIEETISQSLQQSETLRQSILKKAFEGKLINYESSITNYEKSKTNVKLRE
jgi:type I restriction enzyme S subunit